MEEVLALLPLGDAEVLNFCSVSFDNIPAGGMECLDTVTRQGLKVWVAHIVSFDTML